MYNKWRKIPKWYWLFAGFIYLLCVRYQIFSLHCPLRTLTGLYCPGCGITTMFVCLSYGDFWGAYAANPVVLLLSPLLVLLILKQQYPHKWKFLPVEGLTWFCVVTLLVWGIVRNLNL